MAISTGSGCTLSIGTTVGTGESLSQYLEDTYVEVGEVEDLGEFGDESEEVTFTSLSDGRVKKLKGTRDAGTLALVVGSDTADSGQDAMIAAEATNDDYNIKVVLDDALSDSGTPSEHYFRGKVMSKRLAVGTANNVVRRTFNIGINTAITEVDAT